MQVGIMEVVLHIPGASSLKEKRKVVRRIKDRIRNKFNVSLIETEGQNTWQLCVLGFAMVAVQQAALERELNKILDVIESEPELSMTEHWIEFS